jgi:DNA-binding NarL/FixJ family response regulator
MEGIAVSLAECPQLALTHLNCSAPNIWQQVDALAPDVVIFELEIPQSPFIFTLLKERPGILLIALDLECNRVIVLNSRQQFTRTMHDLCQIVEAEVGEQLPFSFEEEFARSLAQAQAAVTPTSSP